MKLLFIGVDIVFIVVLINVASTKKTWGIKFHIVQKDVLDLSGTVRNSLAWEAAAAYHEKNESFICSPISVLLPIGKLALGAKGRTLDELLVGIGIHQRDEVKTVFKPLVEQLNTIPGVTLDIASKIFVQKRVQMKSDFVKEAHDIFGSYAMKLIFSNSDEAAVAINDWVKRETRGMIPTIIEKSQISEETSAVLVNAVYFSGQWKSPFNKVFTDTFFSPKGQQKVSMMSVEDKFNYTDSKTLRAEILEMPYEGDASSFIIILPHKKHSLPRLLSKLKTDKKYNLNEDLKKMTPKNFQVTIPKFKISSGMDLKKLYEKVGIKKVFTMSANLTDMVYEPTYVSAAVHKAVVEVNEIGTEAAAASAIQIGYKSLHIKHRFSADHPFIYIIKAGAHPLFVGTCVTLQL